MEEAAVDLQTGFASGKKNVIGGVPHLRMNNIGSDCKLDLSVLRTVPKELAQEKYLLKFNDILFCHTNSQKLVGKTAVFDLSVDSSFAFSNHLTRIRVNPEVALPAWVWHTLAALWRIRYFETRCKLWVNQATVKRATILKVPVPLASLAEQRRILNKLEAYYKGSRNARTSFEAAQRKLQVLDSVVPAKALRGELSERDPLDEPVGAMLERAHESRSLPK